MEHRLRDRDRDRGLQVEAAVAGSVSPGLAWGTVVEAIAPRLAEEGLAGGMAGNAKQR
jgi:hypothetical protein